jgi:GDSL-like Lipase/Acylhydrolase family
VKKKLLFSAASLLLALLFAEVALRILGVGATGRGSPWFAGGNHPRFLFQPDPVSGYTLRPGFRGRQIARTGEFDVPVAVDARGLRDHPHAAPARPAVLALGDSMTFGEGVPVDRSYPAVLERKAGVRVYNAGVPGHGSPQMVERLRRLLPRIQPDVVLMAFSPTWDRPRCATPFLYKEGFIVAQAYADRLVLSGNNLYLAEVRWPVIGPATVHAKRASVVMRLALPALGKAARSLRRKPEPLPSPRSHEPSARAVDEARHLAERAGARFLAVLLDSRGPGHARDRDVLSQALAARGVPFLALDSLPGIDWKDLHYPRDGHWNAAGHQKVGEALAERVVSLLRQSRTSPRGDV